MGPEAVPEVVVVIKGAEAGPAVAVCDLGTCYRY